MELYGICDECSKERVERMPLIMARPGERLVIREFTGGSGARMRLMTMGLRPGDRLEVITNLNEGQIAVAMETRRSCSAVGWPRRSWSNRTAVNRHDRRVAAQTSSFRRAVGRNGPPDGPRRRGGRRKGPCDPGMQTMRDLKEGQVATIVRVGGNGALRRRLLEMGLHSGAVIRIEKYAPLRDPLELVVNGCHVSLRVEEAAHITVADAH